MNSSADIRAAGKAATARILAAQADKLVRNAIDAGSTNDLGPVRKYAIVTTPRVGSSFFCRRLEETHRLGWPDEWFNNQFVNQIYRAYQTLTRATKALNFESYIDLVIRGTMTPNAVFGVNFHVDQYLEWKQRGIDLMDIGFSKVYVIERRDRIAQAYSYAKAEKTAMWEREAEIAAGFPDGVFIDITPPEVETALNAIARDAGRCRALLGTRIARTYVYEDDLAGDNSDRAVDEVLADFGVTGIDLSSASASAMKPQATSRDRERIEFMRSYFAKTAEP